MRFWVKRYPKGEVGRWLHSKRVGETIAIRGPLKTFPVYEGTWDEIVMLLHHQLLQDNSVTGSTRFTLLHASRNPSELPPASLLQPLVDMAKQHPERLRIHLFVDSFDKESSLASSPGLMNVGRVNKGAIARALDPNARETVSWWQRLIRRTSSQPGNPSFNKKNTLVLVCGPEGMVAAIAGPYGRNYSQGAVGGFLRELGFESGQVWKL
ncbi:hypothetical protein EWM64_g2198 [Hericium alpestre]|uniref:FAD-binding FR-type domain-containing protein n=1 Tax=Hericium alpestre TaxID=135208 RepID=A0A4Z0A634_9AGAM|nr:hypothetical protein EWM64_g2198 [Hericium alpestre]